MRPDEHIEPVLQGWNVWCLHARDGLYDESHLLQGGNYVLRDRVGGVCGWREQTVGQPLRQQRDHGLLGGGYLQRIGRLQRERRRGGDGLRGLPAM